MFFVFVVLLLNSYKPRGSFALCFVGKGYVFARLQHNVMIFRRINGNFGQKTVATT